LQSEGASSGLDNPKTIAQILPWIMSSQRLTST
jgi:hypothetical protein